MTKGKSPLWTAVMVLIIVIIMLLGAFWIIRAVQHSGSDGSAVAVVGDEQISDQEWVTELKKRYGQETLTQILNRRVIQLEGQSLGIQVSDQEIDDNLTERISGYDSPELFYQEMRSQFGLSEQDLRAESRYQIELEKIATAHIEVSDDEIDRYLQQQNQENNTQLEYNLAWIKTNSESDAEQAVQRISDGEEFGKIAQQFSTDSFSAHNGGLLGWIEGDDPFQPEEVLQVIKDMKPGDIMGPIRLSTGDYAVVQVIDVRVPHSSRVTISRETARRKIALEQARPLTDIEQELRKKYNAYILSAPS